MPRSSLYDFVPAPGENPFGLSGEDIGAIRGGIRGAEVGGRIGYELGGTEGAIRGALRGKKIGSWLGALHGRFESTSFGKDVTAVIKGAKGKLEAVGETAIDALSLVLAKAASIFRLSPGISVDDFHQQISSFADNFTAGAIVSGTALFGLYRAIKRKFKKDLAIAAGPPLKTESDQVLTEGIFEILKKIFKVKSIRDDLDKLAEKSPIGEALLTKWRKMASCSEVTMAQDEFRTTGRKIRIDLTEGEALIPNKEDLVIAKLDRLEKAMHEVKANAETTAAKVSKLSGTDEATSLEGVWSAAGSFFMNAVEGAGKTVSEAVADTKDFLQKLVDNWRTDAPSFPAAIGLLTAATIGYVGLKAFIRGFKTFFTGENTGYPIPRVESTLAESLALVDFFKRLFTKKKVAKVAKIAKEEAAKAKEGPDEMPDTAVPETVKAETTEISEILAYLRELASD